MKKLFSKKLRSTRGETIAETLVSLLIITLAMTMLAGSIVSAARINRKVRDTDTSFQTASAASATAGSAVITHGSTSDRRISVNIYSTGNGYVYYEPAD